MNKVPRKQVKYNFFSKNETPQVRIIDFLSGTHASDINLSQPDRPSTPPVVKRLVRKPEIPHKDKEISPSRLNREAAISYYQGKIKQHKKRKAAAYGKAVFTE